MSAPLKTREQFLIDECCTFLEGFQNKINETILNNIGSEGNFEFEFMVSDARLLANFVNLMHSDLNKFTL